MEIAESQFEMQDSEDIQFDLIRIVTGEIQKEALGFRSGIILDAMQ